MPFGIDMIDRYIVTFLDLIRLRPRRFIVEKNRIPTGYMSPYQFLFASLSIVFIICATSISLERFVFSNALPAFPGKEDLPSPETISVYLLTFTVAMMLLNSLYFRIVSRWWPIRGSATFRAIFKLQCYGIGIRLVPSMALQLIMIPFLTGLVAIEVLTFGSYMIVCVAIGGLIGSVSLVLWDVPGVAAVNGVSTQRCWGGIAFWAFVLSMAIGTLGGVIAAHHYVGQD